MFEDKEYICKAIIKNYNFGFFGECQKPPSIWMPIKIMIIIIKSKEIDVLSQFEV